jgi:fatty-acyl-CoA synthase
MIHPEWLEAFAEALKPAGFKPSAFLPSYGIAECALAVSFATVGGGVQIDSIDGDLLSDTAEARPFVDGAPTRRKNFVCCGPPLPGFEVEVRDEDGTVLPERRVGRIHLRGPSVMNGYYNAPEPTSEVLSADRWLNTGDLGYFANGTLYLTGRAKDLLIINGRNIWPQDLESLAEQQPEVRPTDASAFSVHGSDGTEVAVLVVQVRETDPRQQADLADRLHEAVSQEFGIRCLIELVPPHTLPRTSSGKLSRRATRKEFLDRHDDERIREAAHLRFLVSDGGRRPVAA